MQDFSSLAAGFVLAGGKSSRMGVDKARLQFRGLTLIEIALTTLRALTSDVRIAGCRPDLHEFASSVADEFPQCGPLGGIEAALRASKKEWVLILAIDTPLVPALLFEYLLQRAIRDKVQVVVPCLNGKFEPLCAIYHKSVAQAAREALERKQYRVDRIFPKQGLCRVSEQELASIRITASVFANLNTPEELEALSKGEPDQD